LGYLSEQKYAFGSRKIIACDSCCTRFAQTPLRGPTTQITPNYPYSDHYEVSINILLIGIYNHNAPGFVNPLADVFGIFGFLGTRECANPGCSHSGKHYYASRVLMISLPKSTYGLDVLAYIGWQHEHGHKQLVEIQREHNQRGILINERNTGKL
jgi:hypothetical protein